MASIHPMNPSFFSPTGTPFLSLSYLLFFLPQFLFSLTYLRHLSYFVLFFFFFSFCNLCIFLFSFLFLFLWNVWRAAPLSGFVGDECGQVQDTAGGSTLPHRVRSDYQKRYSLTLLLLLQTVSPLSSVVCLSRSPSGASHVSAALCVLYFLHCLITIAIWLICLFNKIHFVDILLLSLFVSYP